MSQTATAALLAMLLAAAGSACSDPDQPGGGGTAPALTCDEDHPQWTVGLLSCKPSAFSGYTLMTPLAFPETYLLDMRGRVVHHWKTARVAALSAYLLPDGKLLRPSGHDLLGPENSLGGEGGLVEIFDWNGNVVWQYEHFKKGAYHQHHDVAPMPNGNILILSSELISKTEALAAGLSSKRLSSYNGVWVDYVVEVKPTGKTTGQIVWEWHLWDHYIQDLDPAKAKYGDVAAHPELMDFNYVAQMQDENDLSHFNAVDYNPDLDQISFSIWVTGEVIIIDHGTTTAQSKGHSGGKQGKGGDILYRWGNPDAYRAGTAADTKLFSQHGADWIPKGLPGAGNMLIFNNGLGRPGGHWAEVEEITPPATPAGAYPLKPGKAHGPSNLTWSYAPPAQQKMISLLGGNAQRLPNGNTLFVNSIQGALIEVTKSGAVAWRYANPVNEKGPARQGHLFSGLSEELAPIVMEVRRYPPSYPGLANRTLASQGVLELPAN